MSLETSKLKESSKCGSSLREESVQDFVKAVRCLLAVEFGEAGKKAEAMVGDIEKLFDICYREGKFEGMNQAIKSYSDNLSNGDF